MPTYRRPDELRRTLGVLSRQTKVLDHLVIVDNGNDVAIDARLKAFGAAKQVTVLGQSRNIGPAGALSVGMHFVLEHAGREDWVATMDDDDPPRFNDVLQQLWDAGQRILVSDRRCGAVGVGGSRLDWRSFRVGKLLSHELTGGPIRVFTLSGNHVPMIRVGALADVGPHCSDLFFGHEELEFFLRMNECAWTVYCETGLLERYRASRPGGGRRTVPRLRLEQPDWRRFYSVRNRVYLAHRYSGPVPAARVTGELMAKVLVNAILSPRAAAQHAKLTAAAVRDGWIGQLGITLEPELTADGHLPLNRRKRRVRSLSADEGPAR